jgi:hypothetical protein
MQDLPIANDHVALVRTHDGQASLVHHRVVVVVTLLDTTMHKNTDTAMLGTTILESKRQTVCFPSEFMRNGARATQGKAQPSYLCFHNPPLRGTGFNNAGVGRSMCSLPSLRHAAAQQN